MITNLRVDLRFKLYRITCPAYMLHLRDTPTNTDTGVTVTRHTGLLTGPLSRVLSHHHCHTVWYS